ncbi:hypothetical protein HAX54_051632, partial [Datura stramonium]|nr:hypothetical protein [Datura stramonium]
VDMNPSKSQKSEIESTLKIAKHSFIPPGALARGLGKSFSVLGSARVNAEKRPLVQVNLKRQNKMRGQNRCKNVARLKLGEKLHVTFYHNRVVGKHHASFARHLGILVCDHSIYPLCLHSWADIEKYKLDHLWEAIL